MNASQIYSKVGTEAHQTLLKDLVSVIRNSIRTSDVITFKSSSIILISMNEIPWIGTGGDPNIKWNILSIGGNDHHHVTENGVIADKEYWYAIDNLEVYNKLPAGPKALAMPPPTFSGNAK